MTVAQIVGIVFIFAAILDLVLGFVVVGPRIPEEGRRKVVQVGLSAGAVVLLALGAAFLAGVMGVGSSVM
ncbi:MAG: hypothetical protein ACE5G2_04415 [Candidatus Krumholzibacteriia bacterium]